MSIHLVHKARWRAKRAWWKLTLLPALRALGVDLGDGVQVLGRPVVSVAPQSRIRIGARSVLCSDSEFTALGVNHPVVLRTLRPGAEIIIGDDTGISGGSICAAVSVRLGSGCLLGANVTLADTDFHAVDSAQRRYNRNPDDIASAPIVVEDNVFIGAGAVLLKGVTVGANSVVGAGAVVTRNVPANVIVAGNPARVIRPLRTSLR